jgi:Protein of unknown function (DUF1360)
MIFISASFFVALFLLIWFKTEAFVEYCRLFRLTRFFKVAEYLEVMKADASFSYPMFLVEYYNSFLTRLLSCPICTSVWIGLALGHFTGWLLMPAVTIFGLVIYSVLVKIL